MLVGGNDEFWEKQDMNVKTVNFQGPKAAQEFRTSLRETGFAVISNHPIPFRLVTETFEEWARFFASASKFEHKFDQQKQAGYFPFKSENAKDSKKKDLKEFFHYYPWGELPPEARTLTPVLYRELLRMGAELLRWLDSESPSEVKSRLSMPLVSMIENSGDTLLRPIHYPPMDGSEEEGAVRAAAHEDINLITLLPAATAPGLQVKDLQGLWIDVPCDPGTIVVNSGDMLKLATDGYYPSTTHRVVNPIGPEARKPRYSMPLFLHPRKDVRLSPGHTAGSYLAERLREIGLLPPQPVGY